MASKKKKNRKKSKIILSSFFKKVVVWTVVIVTMNTSFLPILTTIVFAEDSNSTIINENATEKEKSSEDVDLSKNIKSEENSKEDKDLIVEENQAPIDSIQIEEFDDTKIDSSQISTTNYDSVMRDMLKRSATIPIFIDEISASATKLASDNDLYASVMIAQAILESSYGNSILGQAPVYNLFGIKGKYKGQSFIKESLEELPNGTIVSKKSEFRKYSSWEQSQIDYVEKLKNGPNSNAGDPSWAPLYYSGSWRSNANSYQEATAALVGKYATDSKYNEKLNSVIQQYNLTQYDLPSRTILDAPKVDEKVTDNQVVIAGWALTNSPISDITVSVNDQVVGNAQTGIQRNDVYAAYPMYNNANAGFNYTLSNSELKTGENAIKLDIKTTNGNREQINTSIVKVGYESKLYIEKPLNNTSIGNTTTISGWGLAKDGVEKIEFYADNVLKGSTIPNHSRNDVYNLFPEYNQKNSGFSFDIDTSNLSDSNHTIKVKLYGVNGNVVEQNINITKKSLPIYNMPDNLGMNTKIFGNYEIRGWALADEPIKEINIVVDGNKVGTANYGNLRNDVYNLFPEYNNRNSGYSFNLNAVNLSAGKHEISVSVVTHSGKQNTVKRTVVKPEMPMKIYRESPTKNQIIKGKASFNGWALAEGGVESINIYVDGKLDGKATINQTRNDVYNAFPEYQDKNAGFKYDFDGTKLSEGSHDIKIEVVSKLGVKSSETVKITKPVIPMMNMVDNLPNNTKIFDEYTINGWALAGDGVKSVEILVDGVLNGTATYGLSRNDVYTAYPEYNNRNSGYSYKLNAKNLKNGTHTIEIKVVSNNNKIESVKRTIIKDGLITRSTLESPGVMTLTADSQYVGGWFLSSSKVKKIDVYLNGVNVGQASYGHSRKDVQAVYPEYQNENAGFNYQLDTKQLKSGKHNLKLAFLLEDGSTEFISRDIYKGNLPIKASIDAPAPNQLINSSTQVVRGWMLADEGMSYMQVFLDNVYQGNATVNLARGDVAALFPEYNNGNSGYSYNLNIANLANGIHTVKLVGVTNGGRNYSISQQIRIGELSGKKIYVDAGHGGKDPGAVSGGVNEKDLNLKVALKLENDLKAKGAEVIMSRNTDQFLELWEIASKANASKADIFISIHHNSATPAAFGIETYSYDGSGSSRNLSNIFSTDLSENKSTISPFVANNNVDRIYKSQQLASRVQSGLISNTGAYDRGAKQTDFHVIRETNMPAILTELGFITNNNERGQLVTDAYQTKLSKGITDGVVSYFK